MNIHKLNLIFCFLGWKLTGSTGTEGAESNQGEGRIHWQQGSNILVNSGAKHNWAGLFLVQCQAFPNNTLLRSRKRNRGKNSRKNRYGVKEGCRQDEDGWRQFNSNHEIKGGGGNTLYARN